jgi:hypothetical protein
MTKYRIVLKTNKIGEEFYLIQYQVFWFIWAYHSIMLGHDYSQYFIANTINEADCEIERLKQLDKEKENQRIVSTKIIKYKKL